jgi:hypothetical protein
MSPERRHEATGECSQASTTVHLAGKENRRGPGGHAGIAVAGRVHRRPVRPGGSALRLVNMAPAGPALWLRIGSKRLHSHAEEAHFEKGQGPAWRSVGSARRQATKRPQTGTTYARRRRFSRWAPAHGATASWGTGRRRRTTARSGADGWPPRGRRGADTPHGPGRGSETAGPRAPTGLHKALLWRGGSVFPMATAPGGRRAGRFRLRVGVGQGLRRRTATAAYCPVPSL